MSSSLLLIVLLGLSAVAFHLGRRRAIALGRASGSSRSLHSRPVYYGTLTALWCGLPALFIFALWQALESNIMVRLTISTLPEQIRSLPAAGLGLVINDIKNLAAGSSFGGIPDPVIEAAADYYRHLQELGGLLKGGTLTVLSLVAMVFGLSRLTPKLRARNQVEALVKVLLIICSTMAILTTIGIVLSVLFEALRFFQKVPLTDFLFGLEWSPQTAIRTDQVGSSGAFGAVPVFAGTLMISALAMLVAVPIGLMSAIYLAEYAGKKVRAVAKPLIEILAGVPTVVYGFFAALVVAPFIRDLGAHLGISVSSESALAAGLIMGIMIIPFIMSISDDVINAVPQTLRDGSYALGATKNETVRRVLLPAALPGIVGGVLLAVSRAIGETMIVVMAAGLSAKLTANPLQAVTTVTVQIVTLLVGDQEFDSPKTLAAFALGLLLFLITLLLNVTALYIVRKYREQYE
ncbi:MAG: phosphate ABC transporter permease subunit PstC [Proteobacteria bacterium]|nr:phosphate ABC transporter permease subunit PstC [Pseudomonadota bacterium]MBU1714249.1 phosphate ABC transporter permease subunit PstC [Pseudomonadota bacterium]